MFFFLLVSIVKDFIFYLDSNLSRSSEMVLSLGSGSGANEMTSSIPCLCLEKSKQCVFSGAVNLKSLSKENKNGLYHAYFDFTSKVGVYEICEVLKLRYPHLKLRILFQHPNPSDEVVYSIVGSKCIKALMNGFVSDIHFVYDTDRKKNKNCWERTHLYQVFTSQVCSSILSNLMNTEEIIVSEKGDDSVNHPIFGLVSRMGWAFTRKGTECSFLIQKQ